MNTLISIVMAIVLNFLGVEMQERKNMAQSQYEQELQIVSKINCNNSNADSLQLNCSSIKNEYKCKLSK